MVFITAVKSSSFPSLIESSKSVTMWFDISYFFFVSNESVERHLSYVCLAETSEKYGVHERYILQDSLRSTGRIYLIDERLNEAGYVQVGVQKNVLKHAVYSLGVNLVCTLENRVCPHSRILFNAREVK